MCSDEPVEIVIPMEDDDSIVDVEGLRAAMSTLAETIEADIGPIVSALKEHIARTLKPIADVLEELGPSVRAAVLVMANAGWYYDSEMGMVVLDEMRDLLAAGQTQYANEALCEYFENRLSEIEARIISEFPGREDPIRAAFRAHRNGEYFLSIPVLLAQADGICVDVTAMSLYGKLRGEPVPKTKAFVDAVDAGTVIKALLSPLTESLPISASVSQRGPDWDSLNRHQVMHGESVDYGTRMNSLKAISLLSFIARTQDVVRRASS